MRDRLRGSTGRRDPDDPFQHEVEENSNPFIDESFTSPQKEFGVSDEELKRRLASIGVEDDSPFVEEPRYKLYNPRRMRWEWSDTGEPCEEEPKKPAPRTGDVKRVESGRLHVELAKKTGFKKGPFAGDPISEVPTWYLENFIERASFKDNAFYQACEEELKTR